MNRAKRIDILREIEVYCYRVCYQLLANEAAAHEAAKETLVRLYERDTFFTPSADQASLLKKESAAVCMSWQLHHTNHHESRYVSQSGV
ncbi:hypothetical protein ACFO9Q_11405 [Paenibacillus sp. GCM10023252]|uniref:hypothetical protein n=1 Tax=Paenibacillus sp. GCM10023252 TaxID=3252649 RepID=UPI00361CB7A6